MRKQTGSVEQPRQLKSEVNREVSSFQKHKKSSKNLVNLMQSSKSQKNQPMSPSATTPANESRYKKQKLINQIKVFDIENSKLKRLGLFFSEEKLEQAKQILDNFKKKQQE